jgi:hypothetical protein
MLIVRHLMVNTTKENEVFWFVEAIGRKCWVVARPLAFAGNEMALVAHHRLIIRGSGIHDELVPTHRAPITGASPEYLSCLVYYCHQGCPTSLG